VTERTLSVSLEDLLSLVNCAKDYGFARSVFLDAMADWTGRAVSDAEIRDYAQGYMTPEMIARGFGEEDHDEAIETLTRWRDYYCRERP
jgi:hypothetical protein